MMADDSELVERVMRHLWGVFNDVPGAPPVVPLRVTPPSNIEKFEKLARAAIAEVQRWRPIETAPVDREILLLWKSGGIGKGRWETDESWEVRNWAHKAVPEGWRCDGDACIPVNQADCTHWQPLPAPPQ
jgi:hypothetical protein